MRPDLSREVARLGEPISETVKLGALFVFGATLTLRLDTATVGFAALTLVAARPVALLFAFLGGGLRRAEWLSAAWFGPRGFASLMFAALVLASGIPRRATCTRSSASS